MSSAPVRLLRRLLLDSPLSRMGAEIATLLALLIGAPLSTGRIEFADGLIVCRGLPRWAFRRGGTCVGRVFLTRDATGPRVLRHERVHLRQWQRYGLLFPFLYWAAGADPLRNRFEIEAGLADGGYLTARPSASGGTRRSQRSSRSS
ncbi:MAG: Fe-S oxidoreductase [Pseudoclavibacter sp.]|nr:Fe-S oxidoreductase [Pseudoclavibacter sp.]